MYAAQEVLAMKRIILAALLAAAFASQASAYVGVSIGGPYPGVAVSVGPPPPPVYAYYPPPPQVYGYYAPGAYYGTAPPPPAYVYKYWHHPHYYRSW